MNMKYFPLTAISFFVCAFMIIIPSVCTAGAPINVDCVNKKKSGTMSFNAARDGESIVFTVKYPVSIKSLLGGFTKGSKDWSADIKIYLDIDNNPGTGMKADEMFEPGQGGSEFMLEADEIATSVARDAQGKWINRPMLLMSINMMDEPAELPGGNYPEWEFKVDGKFQAVNWVDPQDSDTMRLVVPLSVFGLKAGDVIRVSGVASLCRDSFPFPGKAEAKITLK